MSNTVKRPVADSEPRGTSEQDRQGSCPHEQEKHEKFRDSGYHLLLWHPETVSFLMLCSVAIVDGEVL